MKLNTVITAVVLCTMACISTSVFAEDDPLVDSATPAAIAEPVNPKPGLVFNGYNRNILMGEKFKDVASVLASETPVKTTVVNTDKFSFEGFLNNLKIGQGVWEGFLKCKRSAKCVFLVKQKNLYGSGLPEAITYSALISSSRSVADIPRFSRMGFFV